APPGRAVKEEYVHECIEMDVPSVLSSAPHDLPPAINHAPLPMPPSESYRQPLPPLKLPKSPQAAVSMYPNMSLSPPVAPGCPMGPITHSEGLLQIAPPHPHMVPTPAASTPAQNTQQNGYPSPPKQPYHNPAATWTGSSTAAYTPNHGQQQNGRGNQQPPLHHPNHYCTPPPTPHFLF
ncbi:hypothetical protein FKM82_029296, partial [Ascaphus truei]